MPDLSYVGLGFGLNIRKILWLLAIMRELAEIRAFSKISADARG
jgi:hypothetical protein